jgi:predicted outer membrane repeat protein
MKGHLSYAILRCGAGDQGGAVSIGPGSIGDVEDSLFTWNEASDGGAVYVAELGAADISRAVFTNNIALGFGGAIHVGGMANIDGSSFKDNTGIEGVRVVVIQNIPTVIGVFLWVSCFVSFVFDC